MGEPMNPPAFPRPSTPNGPRQDGMTLRDYFAGQALAGWLADPTAGCADEEGVKRIASVVYLIADAMLAERAKDPQP